MNWHLFENKRDSGVLYAAVDAETADDALARLKADDPAWNGKTVRLIASWAPHSPGLLFWFDPK